MNKENKTTIFTDGSSRGNPGKGGWGAVVILNDNVTELGGREDNTTNNRMELEAAIVGLSNASGDITVHTDSSYVINGITKWVNGWKRNGWMTKAKGEVLNKDLWERLVEAKEGKKVSWNYVGGHSGIAGNERCDVVATTFADDEPTELYKGPLSGYHVKDIANLIGIPEQASKKSHSKAQAFSYISMVNGDIQIHKTWAECETRVKGKSNTRYRKAISAENEGQIIEEFRKR